MNIRILQVYARRFPKLRVDQMSPTSFQVNSRVYLVSDWYKNMEVRRQHPDQWLVLVGNGCGYLQESLESALRLVDRLCEKDALQNHVIESKKKLSADEKKQIRAQWDATYSRGAKVPDVGDVEARIKALRDEKSKLTRQGIKLAGQIAHLRELQEAKDAE